MHVATHLENDAEGHDYDATSLRSRISFNHWMEKAQKKGKHE